MHASPPVLCKLTNQTNDRIDFSFVSAKCRVAPLKWKTIPIELPAAVMGSKLTNNTHQAIEI